MRLERSPISRIRGLNALLPLLVLGVALSIQPTEGAPFAYVTSSNAMNSESGTVSVIDTATNSLVATVKVEAPYKIAITPNGKKAYVTHKNNGTISVLNAATGTVVATLPVSEPEIGHTFGIALPHLTGNTPILRWQDR